MRADLRCRQIDGHFAVKAPNPTQGWINCVWPARSCNDPEMVPWACGSNKKLTWIEIKARREASRAAPENIPLCLYSCTSENSITQTMRLTFVMGTPDCVAAPSSNVSNWATTRASCGCCVLRTGAKESSSSKNMIVGCCSFACSLASSKASRRRFSDSPVSTDPSKASCADHAPPHQYLTAALASQYLEPAQNAHLCRLRKLWLV